MSVLKEYFTARFVEDIADGCTAFIFHRDSKKFAINELPCDFLRLLNYVSLDKPPSISYELLDFNINITLNQS